MMYQPLRYNSGQSRSATSRLTNPPRQEEAQENAKMLLLVVPAAYKFIAKNIGFPRDIAQKLEEEM